MADAQYPNNQEAVSGATKSTDVENKTYEKDLWATRIMDVPNNMKMRVEYSSGNAIYVGYAPRGLAEGTDGWLLFKYTYDGSNQCTDKDVAYGNWTNRAAESYS